VIRKSEPRLLAEAAVLGVVGALAAQLFMWALHLCEHIFLTWLTSYRFRVFRPRAVSCGDLSAHTACG